MSIGSTPLSHLEKFIGVRRTQLPYLVVYLVAVSWILELSDEEGEGKGKFDAALRYYKEMEEKVVAAIVEARNGRG